MVKKIEIVEIGLVTIGMLAAGAGLVFGGIKLGMKQGEEAGHKTGFDKGAVAQYNHMMKEKGKKPIGFGPHEIEEAEENDDQ